MKINKRATCTSIILILILAILISIAVKASSSDYRLSGDNIVLDGEVDETIKIELISSSGGTYYGFDANWSLSEVEETEYFQLTNLEPSSNVDASENSASTGRVVWADDTYTGFNVQANKSIWTATYKVDKDTPEGNYTINLDINAITGGTAGYDSDEDIHLSTTVTVTRDEDRKVVTFTSDEGVEKINNFYSNDFTSEDAQGITTAYARNGETGRIDNSGSGQVNFKVELKEGYVVDSISIDGSYTDIEKQNSSNQNVYTIKNITSDLTVNITTMEETVHDLTHIERKEPTCTEKGNIAYYICSLCNKMFADEDCNIELTDVVLPVNSENHDWDEGEVILEPTCTETGTRLYRCNHNNEHTKTETIEPLGHTLRKVEGNVEYYICDVCNKRFKDEEGTIEANDVTVTFINDNQTVKTETVPYGESATPPEITKEGYTLSWDNSYTDLTQDVEVVAQWTKVEEYYITSDIYEIDIENYITKVSPQTDVERLKRELHTNGEVKIFNTNNQEISGQTIVKTGDRVQVTFNESIYNYEIAVKGDINGDGIITLVDLSLINQIIVGKTSVTGAKEKAADINCDGNITLVDLSLINQVIVGKITV